MMTEKDRIDRQEITLSNEVTQARQFQNTVAVTQRCDALLHLIGPTDENNKQRLEVFQKLAKEILKVLPTALIVPYGSFVSKCYLFNSDIDFCCWTPDGDIREAFKLVAKTFQQLPEIQSVQLVDADVPIVKCQLQQLGCDISFTQPAGILTSYLLELLDKTIGKNHLFKRSLVLVQNFLLNESHALGSHNFMLGSYALRTMVGYILLQCTSIQSPLQTLLATLTFFSKFDFQNNVITLFGILSVTEFQQLSPQQAIQQLQQQFLQNYGRDSTMVKLTQAINQTVSLRIVCDEKYVKEKGFWGIGEQIMEGSSDISLNIKKYAQNISQMQHSCDFSDQLTITQKSQVTSMAIAKFIRSMDITKYFKDEQQFQFKYINVSDPLFPSNNLGKSVSLANLQRMQRCMEIGTLQVSNLFQMMLEGEQSCTFCIGEFDALFISTIATSKPSGGKLDFEVNQELLFESIIKVASYGFGVKSSGIVWDAQ